MQRECRKIDFQREQLQRSQIHTHQRNVEWLLVFFLLQSGVKDSEYTAEGAKNMPVVVSEEISNLPTHNADIVAFK